jgi:hypothetical protein
MPALSEDDDTDEILERTSWGRELARDRLLERHRARFRTMIAVRLDRRYQARIDASDLHTCSETQPDVFGVFSLRCPELVYSLGHRFGAAQES